MYTRPIRRIGAVDAKCALKACDRDDCRLETDFSPEARAVHTRRSRVEF